MKYKRRKDGEKETRESRRGTFRRICLRCSVCDPGSVPCASWENQQFLMTRAFLKKGGKRADAGTGAGTQHSIDRPTGQPRPSLSMRRAFRSALIYLSIASPISCSLSPVRIASFFHSTRIRLWSPSPSLRSIRLSVYPLRIRRIAPTGRFQPSDCAFIVVCI